MRDILPPGGPNDSEIILSDNGIGNENVEQRSKRLPSASIGGIQIDYLGVKGMHDQGDPRHARIYSDGHRVSSYQEPNTPPISLTNVDWLIVLGSLSIIYSTTGGEEVEFRFRSGLTELGDSDLAAPKESMSSIMLVVLDDSGFQLKVFKPVSTGFKFTINFPKT